MQRHVTNQLSAYIDGEARHPERIAAHLDRCEACEREYQELLTLSASMKALPRPDVRPEFATRVMAHVRETTRRPARVAQPWLSIGLALAVIALILGAGWLVQSTDSTGSRNRPFATSDSSALTSAPSPSADDGSLFEFVWPLEDPAAFGLWPPESIEPIAQDEWTTPLVEAWGPHEDLDTMLQDLDQEAEDNFRALLWLYAQDTGTI